MINIYNVLVQGGSAEVELKKGGIIKLTTNPDFQEKGNADTVFLDYQNISNVVKPGNRIFIDDGLISVICQSVGSDALTCVIENGGILQYLTLILYEQKYFCDTYHRKSTTIK